MRPYLHLAVMFGVFIAPLVVRAQGLYESLAGNLTDPNPARSQRSQVVCGWEFISSSPCFSPTIALTP
jgi:hypothetical protein